MKIVALVLFFITVSNFAPAESGMGFLVGKEKKKVELERWLKKNLSEQINKSFHEDKVHVAMKVRWKMTKAPAKTTVNLEKLDMVVPMNELDMSQSETQSLVSQIYAVEISLIFPYWVDKSSAEGYKTQARTEIPLVHIDKIKLSYVIAPRPPSPVAVKPSTAILAPVVVTPPIEPIAPSVVLLTAPVAEKKIKPAPKEKEDSEEAIAEPESTSRNISSAAKIKNRSNIPYGEYLDDPNFLRLIIAGILFVLLVYSMTLHLFDSFRATRVIVQMPPPQPTPSSSLALVPVEVGVVERVPHGQGNTDDIKKRESA